MAQNFVQNNIICSFIYIILASRLDCHKFGITFSCRKHTLLNHVSEGHRYWLNMLKMSSKFLLMLLTKVATIPFASDLEPPYPAVGMNSRGETAKFTLDSLWKKLDLTAIPNSDLHVKFKVCYNLQGMNIYPLSHIISWFSLSETAF